MDGPGLSRSALVPPALVPPAVKDIANSGLVLHNTRSRLVAKSALNTRIIIPCVLTLNTLILEII